MDDQTAQSISHWKTHRWLPSHIPFTDAVYSLLSDDPLIELKAVAGRPTEWVVCRVGTNTPAEMTFAGVFAEADPYDTGNLLPRGFPVPPEWDEDRVARHAGFKAAYTYALETYHDKEIWDLQHILDEHAKSVKGFNRHDLPRLEWQNGENQQFQLRFFLRTPMFFPHQSRGSRPRVPERLHAWVKNAHAKSRSYRANPNPPRVRAVEEGELRDIGKCKKKLLEYGDVVSIVFGVAYHETPSNWGPVYILYDIVRVMDANRDAYPLRGEEDVVEERRDGDNFSLAGVAADTPEDPSEPEDGDAGQQPHASPPPPDDHAAAHLVLTQPSETADGRGLLTGGWPSAPLTQRPRESEGSPGPSTSQGLPRHAEMEVDDDDAASIATEATLASIDTPFVSTGRSPGPGPSVPSKRNVRPRLDDDVDEMRIDIDRAADPQSSRTRRGGHGKARRAN